MTSHMKLALHIRGRSYPIAGFLFSCSCGALGNAPVAAIAEEAVSCHARDRSFKQKMPELLDLAWGLSGQLSNSGNLVPRYN